VEYVTVRDEYGENSRNQVLVTPLLKPVAAAEALEEVDPDWMLRVGIVVDGHPVPPLFVDISDQKPECRGERRCRIEVHR